ncbi:MAG: hypothetical protein H6Q90_5783 [Deltaproteobacteria bacterium]|nr:hypothetical protein [Deltaproteobacteria bacterium]
MPATMARRIYRDLTKSPTLPRRARDERLLLDAIIADPDDDAPRLVYADWLVERADPRGELIIVQCELARLGGKGKRAELKHREAELLRKHKKDWVGRFGGQKIQHGSTKQVWTRVNPTRWMFERGFVTWCSMKGADFARNAAAILEAEPLQRAHLTDRNLTDVAAAKGIEKLRGLDLRRVRLKEYGIDGLCEGTRFRGLEVLGLLRCGLGTKGMKRFAERADPRRMPSLHTLELRANRLGDPGAVALAGARILTGIRTLDLTGNRIGPAGAKALAASPYLDNLEQLYTALNSLGAGAKLLTERFGKRHIQSDPGLTFDI